MFSPLIEGGTTHIAVMTIRLLILALAGVALYRIYQLGEVKLPSHALVMPILSFLVCASWSVAFSSYLHQSTQWLAVLLSYTMFLYLLVFFIARWEHVLSVVGVLLVMACFQASLSALQFGKGILRPNGTFFNPNFLAGYLVVAWVMLLSYLVYQPIRRTRSLSLSLSLQGVRSMARYLFPICLFAALSLAILGTGSRGGVLAAVTGASIVVGTRFGFRAVAGIVILCAAGVLLIPNPLQDRVYTEHASNPVTYTRIEMWMSAVRMIMDHPLGIGLGLYQYVFPQYSFPVESQIARYGMLAQTPHNEYLQIGVELGVPGLLIVGWGLYLLSRQVCRVLGQRLTRLQRLILVGAAGAIGSLLAHAAVDSNLHEPALALALVACVAILIASSPRLFRASSEDGWVIPVAHRSLSTILAAILIGLMALFAVRLGVAWTYYERGNELNRSGDLAGAVDRYDSAAAMDPGKALYQSALAAARFRQFERSENVEYARIAAAHLSDALKLNPLDGRLAGLLGKVHARLSSISGLKGEERRSALLLAEKAYERAIIHEPFNAVHYWEAGQVYLQLEDGKASEASIRRAAELEPNFLRAREWLARIYLNRGELSRARDEYAEIKARQERYRQIATTVLEKEFLVANSDALGAAISRIGGES